MSDGARRRPQKIFTRHSVTKRSSSNPQKIAATATQITSWAIRAGQRSGGSEATGFDNDDFMQRFCLS